MGTIRVELNYKQNLGIPTAVHYPMPLHVQECLNLKEGDFPISEKEIMSLPMNPYVSDEEIEFIKCNMII